MASAASNDVDYQIPSEIERQYVGQWIAWDVEQRTVAGNGFTLETAIETSQAASDAGRLLWYHHILPPDAVIVGGI